jgi:hypothetical protein
MCASWKRGYNPDVVTTGLERIKSIGENGEVSFTGFEFEDYATVLLSSLDISSVLPNRYKRQIVHKGIYSVAKSNTLTGAALLKEILKLEQAYLREPTKKYLLVSDISLHLPTACERVAFGDFRIIFSRQPSTKIQREVFLKLGHTFIGRDLPKSYSCSGFYFWALSRRGWISGIGYHRPSERHLELYPKQNKAPNTPLEMAPVGWTVSASS